MTDTSELDRLRQIPIFADLDDDALHRIRHVATETTVPAGYVMVEKGTAGAGMFVLVDGTATVALPDGEVEIGAGDFVGEVSLLTDSERMARVQAKTDVRLLAIGRRDFHQLLDDEPRIAVGMLKTLARRISRL